MMCSRLVILKLLITFLSLYSTTLAQHENQSYLPLAKADLAKRVTLRFAGTIKSGDSLTKQLSAGPRGASLRLDSNGDLLITGNDRSGKKWSAQLGGDCLGFYAYIADLDKNGLKDLILRVPTCGNGLAPSSHLVTLTFDSSGRPVPFDADGYFQAGDNGIADIVDLNRDGKAELIYMNFDDGYWVTNLYRISNARWEKVRGAYAGYTFPLFTRFTYKPNKKPTTPKPGRRPSDPDLSNRVAKKTGYLLSFEWAVAPHSGDLSMLVGESRRGGETCSPDSWYASSSFVIERGDGRRIVFLSASKESVKTFLDEIAGKRYRISLYGRRSNKCSPEVVWADATRPSR